MKVSDYQRLHDEILEMSFDMDGVVIFGDSSEEDIEKCKWIAAMLSVLEDVPKSKMEVMFKHRNIKFDYIEFIDC